MLKNTIETSRLVFTAKKISSLYYRLELFTDRYYKNSIIYGLYMRINKKLMIYFRDSLIGRLSRRRVERTNTPVLENSRFVERSIALHAILKANILKYFSLSEARNIINDVKNYMRLSPLSTGGVIVVTAVSVNIIFSFLFRRPLWFFDWILRGLFLLSGINCIFSRAKWEDIKKTSFVLRKAQIYIAKF